MNTLTYDLPKYVVQQIENARFTQQTWKCHNGQIETSDTRYVRSVEMDVPEESPLTHIHPESFDYSDVYGKCKILQMMMLIDDKKRAVITPMVVMEFEHQTNVRSFEKEASPDLTELSKFFIASREM